MKQLVIMIKECADCPYFDDEPGGTNLASCTTLGRYDEIHYDWEKRIWPIPPWCELKEWPPIAFDLEIQKNRPDDAAPARDVT